MHQYTSLSELSARTYSTFRKNLIPLLLLSLSPVALVALAAVIFHHDVFETLAIFMFSDQSLSLELNQATFFMLAFILLGSTYILTSTMVATLSAINSDQRVDLRDAITGGKQYYTQMLITTLLVALGVLGGFSLFFIPGLIIALFLLFSFHVIVAERTHYRQALHKSWQLVFHNIIKVLIFVAAVLLVFMMIEFVIDSVTTDTATRELAKLVTEVIVTPFIGLVFTALYLIANDKFEKLEGR